ncbi:MurR/RpiR family transcriptional regulator [Paralcaligenes sp. KSB-10]|uniref:MurR/RpiR family transcriptional regulator n=1 Tax=Paralcaligenes sp. KSB-10 TaxID=2901142 RepID=UPI001E3F2DEA|nr:MurR/RpiR family transcriptional regulator [Paralcaligenes sp. KSB-10]UHL63885.1 MurR/RpiR family transcriptional regulator [Paralcaligenes sp. KSB-10]
MASTPLTIADRVLKTSATMSSTQRRMADYVLSHQFKVATMTIDEFARAVEVSVATANRFARHLGLQGYPHFRAELARGFQAALAPIEKLRSELAHPAGVAEVFLASLQEDIHNFQETQAKLDPKVCERAVDLILSAERIFTVGFGGSGFLAALLQRGLCTSCDYVECLATAGGASHAARRMSRLTSRDLVIAITFPRYLTDTVSLGRAAKKAGASLLLLTDRPTSPLAPDASVVLYAGSERRFSATSETAALGLVEALCAATAYKAKDTLESATGLAVSVMPWLVFEGDSNG